MAQFSFKDYEETQKEKQERTQKSQLKDFVWLNKVLKDNEFVIVRFPYHSSEDFNIETVHKVMDYPGRQYGTYVRCNRKLGEESSTCPLCERGEKNTLRFFVKCLVYIINGDRVEVKPALWDRPFTYAKELNSMIDDYGDLSAHLFKIKREGSGLETRYPTNVVMNKQVYNDDIYKADFSLLDDIDPVKIFTKSYEQYQSALHPEGVEEKVETETKYEDVIQEEKSGYSPRSAEDFMNDSTAEATTSTSDRPRRTYQF